MQPAHSWTYSAYNIAAVAKFTAAVAAEVRRQENAYDETAETLRVQKEMTDFDFTEAKKKLYPPDSQLYREDVYNYLADSEKILSDDLARLQDAYPLGYNGVDPEGGLGTYKLRAALLRHVERIQAERRDSALAAGDGTSSSAAMKPFCWASSSPLWSSTVAKSEHSRTDDAQQNVEASVPSSTAPLRVKVELVEESNTDTPERHVGHPPPLQDMEKRASAISAAELAAASGNGVVDAPHALAQIKLETCGSPNSGFPPSWTSLKAEVAKVTPRDGDNGAYFTPHPSAPGAPFPRYTSTPPPPSAASSPTFVVPVNVRSPATGTLPKKIPSSGAAPPLLSQRAGPSRGSRSKSVARRAAAPATPDTHVSRADADEDTVTQLWRRLWPGQRRTPDTAVADHRHGGAEEVVRPTAVTVKALASVTQKNFDRERVRCAAQQVHVAALLEQMRNQKKKPSAGETGRAGGSVRPSFEKRKKRGFTNATTLHKRTRRRTEAHAADQHTAHRDTAEVDAEDDLLIAAPYLRAAPGTSTAKEATTAAELLTMQRRLKTEMTQLEARQAAHQTMVQELLDALESAADPTPARPSDANEPSEMDLVRSPTATITADQQRIPRDAARQQGGSRRSASRRQPNTAVPAEPAQRQQQEESAVSHSAPLDPKVAAAHKRELVRYTLLHPRQMITQWQSARDADAQWSTTRPDESVFTHSTTAIESIALPPVEDDRQAADLEAYMWPRALEAHVRHRLNGHTDLRGRLRCSYHVALSQEDVRRLEETCAATSSTMDDVDILSVLLPDLYRHVVALPNSGTHGWLYVQGRGEAIVASVKLD
ncbi:hypothetical protein ABB37_02620 [Leptomonas pyrrhocoris]|uniref:Uncharacterized protein n=1 Tax=Leptomonas pyrrhocoris TaxID=157538 RepID=A0A0N0DXD0_LEPPY|nr:hypothetical protein ABB37_02620 [Leptomonas pyrrhocoris]XP_015661285.1 hypothetical protein ABB37_02620 [Leptomonas pyrrhocoris]KPA82845.1 hypothetical protein ABB37_02620 [Leptomonas pyrrhocoris]KPA82846.1 hypothetical protein ABB37_02620 [Leptomonas pyrrhocoris]|eukprot:XP_015661284.1 hypothetical protein ABB37_02620 [Leptomonas pyrrhocoris]